jgi:hypothetical protein
MFWSAKGTRIFEGDPPEIGYFYRHYEEDNFLLDRAFYCSGQRCRSG